MPESPLKHQSQETLNALGVALANAFTIDGDDNPFDALMETLDEMNICREFALESACQRTSRLLANTANQGN